ncbi:hypothetical protein AO058_17875 [Salegentibacter sp. T436]|nr:hypothetical protein AO058_17875 [Salegentibacter sp. T436]
MEKEKSFEYAHNAIKLIISLSTGIIAFTITFLKDILKDEISAICTLKWSWIILGTSILFGIITIFSIIGSLHSLSTTKDENKKKKIDVYSLNIQLPAIITIFSFLVGVALFISFAFKNL